MDRERRQRLIREAVLRAAREMHPVAYEEEPPDRQETPDEVACDVIDRPRRSVVPDTLRELVES